MCGAAADCASAAYSSIAGVQGWSPGRVQNGGGNCHGSRPLQLSLPVIESIKLRILRQLLWRCAAVSACSSKQTADSPA